ncbi:hypothetical protein LguiA_022684 [Lonicera macranthoides]
MKVLFVTRSSGLTIEVGPQETILQIKQNIQHFLGVPVTSQTLTVSDYEPIGRLKGAEFRGAKIPMEMKDLSTVNDLRQFMLMIEENTS